MSFVDFYDTPLYTGAPATTLTPYPYDVSIDGRPYFVSTDPQANEKWGVRFQQTSESLLRDQSDQSDSPGEQSLSPNALWRRSMESWHLGAGQPRYDRKTSSPYRFDKSVGVDVWTEGQIRPLKNTLSLTASNYFGPNATACVAGSRYYVGSGTLVNWIDGPVTKVGTVVTGLPASAVTSMASDGVHVWLATGSNGVYQTTTSTNAASSYATGTASLVGYFKGRLMVGGGGMLYNPTATGALASPLIDLSARSWAWTAFGEGASCIYAAGFAGDQSAVYSVTIKSDGTGLNVPVQAATLPPGEIVRAVYGYLGFVVLGTDKGVRFCNPDANGNLTLGALIATAAPVYDFTGQDRFVWFTWSLYDNNLGGLGRLDLSQFTADLTPAYASDLMVYDASGAKQYITRNVDFWQGQLVFTAESASTTNVMVEDQTSTAKPSYLQSGTIGFGIGDQKAAVYVDLRHDPMPAQQVTAVGDMIIVSGMPGVKVSLAVDTGTFMSLGISSAPGSTGVGRPFPINQLTGETFSLRLDFNPDPVSQFDFPTVHRLTLRAYPQSTRISDYAVPLILRDVVRPDFGGEFFMDVEAERDYLTTLWRTQRIVTYQEGNISTLVALTDVEWLPEKKSADNLTFVGVFVAHLREILA